MVVSNAINLAACSVKKVESPMGEKVMDVVVSARACYTQPGLLLGFLHIKRVILIANSHCDMVLSYW